MTQWKLISLKLIKKSFGDELKFHSNLSFNNSYIRHFPCFYKNILLNWKQYLSTDPETISGILSQNLWFNKHIIIDNSTVKFTKLSQKNINFVDQLVNEYCQFKRWQTLKDEYHLDNDMHFQWAELIHAIPQIWKNKTKQNLTKNEGNPLVLKHHLIKNARILTLDKLTAKEINSILISLLKNKPTSQSHFENSFSNCTFDWKQIYLLPQIITINSYHRNFQYKILYNILYLNKKLYIFGKTDSPLCSICHSNDETVAHLFCGCVRVSQVWSQLRIFFSNDLNLPLLTPQTTIFGFLVETNKCTFKITNHLLLIFKMYIYKSREKGSVDIISSLINETKKINT